MREGVLAVLDALRSGMGAEAIGLFDDDRADAQRSQPPPNFWDAFGDLPCANLDWPSFYRTLKTEQRVEGPCSCGADHRRHGYLLHGRWVLLLVAPPTLAAGAPAVVASALKALAGKLPGSRPAQETFTQEDDGFGEAASVRPRDTSSGAPLWWVRKARQ